MSLDFNALATKVSHIVMRITSYFRSPVDILYVYGDGTAYTDATITAALTAIGSTFTSIKLAPGTWTISNSITIPSNVYIDISTATLSIASGKTFTMNGLMDETLNHKFTGPGAAVFGVGCVRWVSPQWWGAKGDVSTNDYAAWVSMISDAPEFKTTIKLSGIYKIGTNLTINKTINIIGTGVNTGFLLTMGIASDGISYGNVESGSSELKHSLWRDFGIYGVANSCRNALVLTGVMQSVFDNIHIMAGTAATGYGVWARWCIINQFNFITNQHTSQYPVSCTLPTNGFKATKSDDTPQVFIDNTVDLTLEAVTKGIYIYGGSDNLITGIAEGLSDYSVHLKGGDRNRVSNFYSEAAVGVADTNEIVFEDETDSMIGAGVVSEPGSANTNDVQLIGCDRVIVDGLYCSRLNIDTTTTDTRIGDITTSGQTGSGIIDRGVNTQQINACSDGYLSISRAGLFSDFSSILLNGSFERWVDTGTPSGPWTFVSATALRETTIVQHGVSSCKVSITGGTSSKFARLTVPAALMTQNPRGKSTVTGWIYIPTATGADISLSLYRDGGAATAGIDTITTRDVWTKITFNFDNTYSGAYSTNAIHIFNDAATDVTFYLDGWAIVPGIAGGASLFTPNANEFPKYTGAATWNPGSIAASGYLAQDFTVIGATLGMSAQAGAGVDVTDLIVSATVTAANTVTVVLFNPTAGAIDLGSSTWGILVTTISG